MGGFDVQGFPGGGVDDESFLAGDELADLHDFVGCVAGECEGEAEAGGETLVGA